MILINSSILYEKLNVDILNSKLQCDIYLVLKSDKQKNHVNFDDLKEFQESKLDYVRAKNGKKIKMNVIKQWFNQEHNNITVNAKLISNPLFFHFFLSHYQANAGDSINLLAAELKHFQVRCWTDKGDVEVNVDGTKKGIKESKVYLLFLSKDCYYLFY